ncbi:MAG: type II secretion system protein, partial [Bdellovibrionota bacterium]
MRTPPLSSITSEAGFTLFELIVTMVLTSIVFVGAMQAYNAMTAASYDLHIRIETNVQAQAIIQ